MKPLGNIGAIGVWICAAAVVTILGLWGCGELSYRPAAVGKTGEVVVVLDSLLWVGPAGDALR
jgi:hypothetical protein